MTNQQLCVLQAKISELRTALFFCENPDQLNFRTHLVEIEQMDAAGFIWLCLPAHSGQKAEKGECFAVSLQFYRKGISYQIDINGLARIMENKDGKLLIKIDIQKAIFNPGAATPPEFSLHTINGLINFGVPGIRQTRDMLQAAIKKATT